jgi:phosphatidylserine/phosphatidylglycerophosphate/cardiolipin synthase-like enzyme
MRRRSVRLPARFAVLAAACLALIPAAARPAPSAPAALALGESRPLETALGNPALPYAGDVWVEMIRGATRSVDLEEFYFTNQRGEALQPVVDELGRAATRGVKVRLLLDAGMGRSFPQSADTLAMLPNVTVRHVDYHRLAGGVQHAKFFVVDGREAWIGSQNLDWRALSQIHELGVRIRDPRLAAAIAVVFASDWAAADTTKPFAPGAPAKARWPMRVAQGGGRSAQVWLGASPRATTPGGIPWDRDLIVERLANARREVAVQVMQYGTRSHGAADTTLHHALTEAAGRGVRVRLIVADWTLGGGNEDALRDLARRGVEVRISRVPEWSAGYVPYARVEHCKYMVADGEWLWLGTSNWEPSYFLTTRNLGLTIHDSALAAQAMVAFSASWDAPTAAAWGPETHLPAREHGDKPPAGARVYGN